jgi:hypothetical protein
MKRKSPEGLLHAAEELHAAYLTKLRRTAFDELRARVAAKRMDDPDWLDWRHVARILDTIAAGYDVRADYGIRRKSGPRATPGINEWRQLHYWDLRVRQHRSDDDAQQEVAALWGISPERAQQIGRGAREWCESLFPQMTSDQILQGAQILSGKMPIGALDVPKPNRK